VIILSVFRQNALVLIDFRLSIITLSVFKQNFIILSVVGQNALVLIDIRLSIIMVSVLKQNVIILSGLR
jgi:hypothetical protein